MKNRFYIKALLLIKISILFNNHICKNGFRYSSTFYSTEYEKSL